MSSSYRAPWSGRVKALTALGSTVLLGDAALLGALGRVVPGAPVILYWAPWILVGIFAGCALFAVRGYRLEPQALLVQRLLWTTELPLAGLRRAVHDPRAAQITIRGFGNAGLFSILGRRYVVPYGWCRVFATAPENAVVLETATGTFIVSPDRPEDFVREASQGLAFSAS